MSINYKNQKWKEEKIKSLFEAQEPFFDLDSVSWSLGILNCPKQLHCEVTKTVSSVYKRQKTAPPSGSDCSNECFSRIFTVTEAQTLGCLTVQICSALADAEPLWGSDSMNNSNKMRFKRGRWWLTERYGACVRSLAGVSGQDGEDELGGRSQGAAER